MFSRAGPREAGGAEMLAGRGARGPNDPKRWGWGHRVSRAAGG